jgi:hypothetical protein
MNETDRIILHRLKNLTDGSQLGRALEDLLASNDALKKATMDLHDAIYSGKNHAELASLVDALRVAVFVTPGKSGTEEISKHEKQAEPSAALNRRPTLTLWLRSGATIASSVLLAER